MSQKCTLFADRPGQLQQRGVSRQNALMLLAAKTAVSLEAQWLEAFWCEQCQETKWYHVQKHVTKAPQKEGCSYEVSVASVEHWQQAIGVIDPKGNPSVGEFTRRNARMVGYQGNKYFLFGG